MSTFKKFTALAIFVLVSTFSYAQVIEIGNDGGGGGSTDSIWLSADSTQYNFTNAENGAITQVPVLNGGAQFSSDTSVVIGKAGINEVIVNTIPSQSTTGTARDDAGQEANGMFLIDNFDGTSTIHLKNGTEALDDYTYRHTIDAERFGVIPDDAFSDAVGVQAAINYAMTQPGSNVVSLPAGNLIIDQPLVVFKDENNDGAPEFVSITIRGNTSAYAGISGVTNLQFTNTDGFCIGVQLGRKVTIENLAFTGTANNHTFSIEEIIENDDAAWAGGMRNNVFSPHSAIVIDPFHQNVLAGDRYPGLDSYYDGTSATGGSSFVHIEGCAFYRFVNGIMVSPNGTTQNCDNITATYVNGSALKNFWSTGQSQSRDNQITNLYTTGGIQHIVQCSEHGDGIGTAPVLDKSSIAGGTKYVSRISGGFDGFRVTSSSFESIWGLGTGGTLIHSYVGCTMKFLTHGDTTSRYCPVLLDTENASFVNCNIKYFSNGTIAPGFGFDVQNLSFWGCEFEGGFPINNFTNTGGDQLNEVEMRNCDFGFIGGELNFELRDMPNGNNNRKLLAGGGVVQDTQVGPIEDVISTNESNTFHLVLLESADLQNDVITTTQPEKYKVGDILISLNVLGDPYGQSGGARNSIGEVASISGNEVQLESVPYGVTEGVQNIYRISLTRYHIHTFGTTTSGSNTITDVHGEASGSFSVNDHIRGDGIPEGAYVTAVGANTITINLPCTASATNVYLHDAKMRQVGYHNVAPTLGGWAKGDRIYNNFNSQTTNHIWMCTQGGVVGTPQAPVFQAY